MLKRFLKDSAVYGLASILVRGLSVFLVPLYTRVLSPTDYGVLDLLTVFGSLVSLTVALEISQGVARFYPDAPRPEDKEKYASSALWFTVFVYTVFLVVVWVLATPLSVRLLESAQYRELLVVALASFWLSGVFYLVQQQLRWELRPALYSSASVVYAIVSLAVSVLLVLVLRWGVIGVLYGQVVGGLVGLVFGLYLTRHTFRFAFDWARCREMLRFSIPMVPSSIGVFVMVYIDRISIRALMSLADVGVFGIGYRVASVVSLLMIGFQGALTPLVYTYHRDPNTPRELARIFRLFVMLALIVCLGLAMFAREILLIFTTPAFYSAAAVVPLLTPALLLSNMYIFAPGLGIAKKTGTVAVLNVLGAVLNTAANVALVPLWGIRGAALSTCLTSAIVFALYMWYSQKLYFVPHVWPRLALAIGATLAIWALGAQIDLDLWAALIVKTCLLGGAAALFIGLGLVERREILRGWQWFQLRLKAVRP